MMSNYAGLLEQLKQIKQSIEMCEEEIRGLTSLIDELQRSLDSLPQHVPYHQIHKLIPAEANTTYLNILPGAGLGLLTGGAMTGSFLLAAYASMAGAALGLTALAISDFLKNNWNNPIVIEYHDLPFDHVREEYSNGVYILLESNPHAGVYRAQFYPEVIESEFKVTFFVKKENLLIYRNNLIELTNKKSMLDLKHQQLALLQQQQTGLLQEKEQNDAAQRSKARLFQLPEGATIQTYLASQSLTPRSGLK